MGCGIYKQSYVYVPRNVGIFIVEIGFVKIVSKLMLAVIFDSLVEIPIYFALRNLRIAQIPHMYIIVLFW